MGIRTVLMADDDATIRTIAKMSLERVGGWQVVMAASGAEAVRLSAEHVPDVILLDVMMPGMDGPAAFAQLRGNPVTEAIPVVFMTAKVQRHEIQRYLDLGAAGVIGKPFDPMTLPDEIRRIVGAKS